MPSPEELAQVIKIIEETAHKYGVSDAYFVGGYPRTLAMGRPLTDIHDLDIATDKPGRAKELAGWIASNAKADDIHQHHRTTAVTVTLGDVEIDFQGSEPHDHVRPYVRLWGIEETPMAMNIFDRDFTMNSLAIKVGSNELLDISRRGLADIRAKRVVALTPPEVSVPRDPLMITRAVRMAVKYDFQIDPTLWAAMKKHRALLKSMLSEHRLSIEAYVLSKYPKSKGLLDSLGITYLEAPEMIEEGQDMAEA